MQRILFATILSLSLMICLPSSLWAGGLDDLEAGIRAGKTGNYDEAIRLCTKAIESGELSGENLSTVYCIRGTAWAEKGDYDKAIADINKAIEIDPKNAMAYYNRGLAWADKGDYDKAIADFNKAIEIDPKYAMAYYNRGRAWGKKGDYDKAIADCTKAIEIDPKYTMAYNNRCLAWGKKGAYDKAIADCTKAIEIDPKNAFAYNNRALAWGKKGDYDKAIADFNKAIEIDPRYATAYNNRGNVWKLKGNNDRANADYNKAIELDPALRQQVNSLEFPPPAAELGPGERAGCSCGTLQYHTGTDWAAKEGTAIPVADDGIVIRVEENEGAIVYSPTGGFCGRYVVVRHNYPNGRAVYTRYAQLRRLVGNNAEPIRVGTKVKKQDKIGEVGKFGLFHFEVRPVDSKTMDTGTWTKIGTWDESMEWAKYRPVNPSTFDFDEFAKGNSEVTLDKGQSETLPESKKEVKSPEVQEEKKPQEINLADGSKYVGDILNGKMHGQGTYIWASGDKYVGEFQNNRATGGWLYRVNGSKLWISQDSEGKWVVKGQ